MRVLTLKKKKYGAFTEIIAWSDGYFLEAPSVNLIFRFCFFSNQKLFTNYWIRFLFVFMEEFRFLIRCVIILYVTG